MVRQVGIVVVGLVAASTAHAHHGFGNFAMNEDIELTGEITKLAFVNPHSWVYFNVTEPDGSVVEHRCEMRSATTLRRSGWTPEMFPIGERITIQGSPDRAEANACYVSTLVFEDGSSLDRYGQRIPAAPAEATTRATRLPSGEPNIFGDWAQEQVVMTDPRGQRGTLVPLSRVGEFAPGDVPEGQRQIPGARGTEEAATGRNPFAGGQRPRTAAVALTPAGEAAMAALDLGARAARSCQNTSILADWAGEPVNRVAQGNGVINLSYGRLGLQRTIHMNISEHPVGLVPSRVGHSIGHWEGDVLVVDTIGFAPGVLLGTTPHSGELHVVERFSLDLATQRLTRSYTAEDSTYFAAVHSGSDSLIPSNVPYSPEPCEDLTPPVPSAPAAPPATPAQ
jgi:hypothetical protein